MHLPFAVHKSCLKTIGINIPPQITREHTLLGVHRANNLELVSSEYRRHLGKNGNNAVTHIALVETTFPTVKLLYSDDDHTHLCPYGGSYRQTGLIYSIKTNWQLRRFRGEIQ